MSIPWTRVLARIIFPCLVAIFLVTLSAVSKTKVPERQSAPQTGAQRDALQALNQGVEAFKNGQSKEAEQYFLQARQLDPHLISARLQLATTYASEYIPGAPDGENTTMGHAAVDEFKSVLALDPQNLSAMDGLGLLLFVMRGEPFNPDVFREAKSYFQRHTQLRPNDAEPYYWIGVIDWTGAFWANGELRKRFNEQGGGLDDANPLPWDLREQYAREYGPTIKEGIDSLKRAISIKPDYDDAMTYLNLLYRRKAEIVTREDEREELLKMADDLIDKVKEIKDARAHQPQP
jgi:tetratricopeptide (TPR) repeat protein